MVKYRIEIHYRKFRATEQSGPKVDNVTEVIELDREHGSTFYPSFLGIDGSPNLVRILIGDELDIVMQSADLLQVRIEKVRDE